MKRKPEAVEGGQINGSRVKLRRGRRGKNVATYKRPSAKSTSTNTRTMMPERNDVVGLARGDKMIG